MKAVVERDVVIIGGGVAGTAIAHELSAYQLKVTLVEKGSDLAAGTSKANSGIMHAGYNAHAETLKGRLHLRAVQMMPELCQLLHVPFRQIGSIVVAYSPEEVERVRELLVQGQQNGVPVQVVEGEELFALEPELSRRALAGLFAPTAGVLSPYELTFALGENAALNGVEFAFDAEVIAITEQGNWKEVLTRDGRCFSAKIVINAAGLNADDVAAMVGDLAFTILPRKGEYYLYDKHCGGRVHHVLFPVPTAVSKGILVTPTVDGNLLTGPNALESAEKADTATTPAGLKEVFESGQNVLPVLSKRDVINQFAGVRAVIRETEDFYIAPSVNCQGLIHVAGIQSPGLTAAPAIAEYVVQMIADQGLVVMQKKEDFAYLRKAPVRFSELTRDEQAGLIEQDERYGQIICRCELVTEAEIVDAITRPLGARTLGGVKRRVRAGMGRCQGGFCGPRIVELLARYGGTDKLAVTKEGGESYILRERTRVE